MPDPNDDKGLRKSQQIAEGFLEAKANVNKQLVRSGALPTPMPSGFEGLCASPGRSDLPELSKYCANPPTDTTAPTVKAVFTLLMVPGRDARAYAKQFVQDAANQEIREQLLSLTDEDKGKRFTVAETIQREVRLKTDFSPACEFPVKDPSLVDLRRYCDSLKRKKKE